MTIWKLKNSGVEKEVHQWGIDDLELSRTSWSDDTLQLLLDGRRVDAALVFPVRSEVIVRRYDNGVATVWFRGHVRRMQYSGSGNAESQQYAVAGPWWFLKERTFNQLYYTYKGSGAASDPANYEAKYLARIFLCQAVNIYGAAIGYLNTGAQLREILEWARKPFVDAGQTPPFQIGNIGIAVNAPVDEVKNITCAEAARKMFRWSPDSVAWFDYSTTPPTFHCQPRAALTPVTVDTGTTQLAIVPEYERLRTFVRLQYEISSEIDGVSYLGTVVDQWPNPLPATPEDSFHGLEQVIDLRGPRESKITASIAVQAIDTASNDWWLSNLPHYARAVATGKITSFVVNQAKVSVVATTEGEEFIALPNQLLPNSGSLCAWMGVQHQRQKAHSEVDIVFSDGSKLTKTVSVPMTATDAITKKYEQITGRDSGDPIPQNLARQLYEANSVLHYKGSVAFERQEIGKAGGLGNTLNLAGLNPAWADMGAVIQSVTERVNKGSTRLQFGWPEHLMAGDYIDLLRVTRNRSAESCLSSRLGDNSTGLNVDVGSAQAEEHAGTAEHSAGSTITQYRVKSVAGDYLVCRTYDSATNTEGGADVYIAKPFKLRHSIASAVLDGLTVNYTYAALANNLDGTRTATPINGAAETEIVVPRWLVNDLIYAASVGSGTGVTVAGNAVTLLDVNADGRAWVKKYGA